MTIFGDFCGYTIPNVGIAGQVLTTNGVSGTYWQSPVSAAGGTVTSIDITSSNAFITVSGGPITIDGSIALTIGTLSPSKGGTGRTDVGLNGQVLTSNGANLYWSTPASPGAGTVTSVGITPPTFLTASTPITGSGNITLSYNATPLPVANGGTGLTSPGTNGQVLTTLSGVPTWSTPASPGAGTVTSVGITPPTFLTASTPITGSGNITLSYNATPLPVANGGTGVTSSTGSSEVVLSYAPTIALPYFLTRAACSGDFAAADAGYISYQGAYLQWNRNPGDGATWIVNQKGGGPGGIIMAESTTSNVTSTDYIQFCRSGSASIVVVKASPRVSLQRISGSSAQFAIADGSGDVFANTLVNDTCIQADSRLRLKSSSTNEIIMQSPVFSYNDSYSAKITTTCASAVGAYFSGASGTTSIGDGVIKSDQSLYIGTSAGQLRLIASSNNNVYCNGRTLAVVSGATISFERDQQIFSAGDVTLRFYQLETSFGQQLDVNPGSGIITNDTGRTIMMTISYSVVFSSPLSVGYDVWITKNSGGAGNVFAVQRVAQGDFVSGTASIILANTDTVRVWSGNQGPYGSLDYYNKTSLGLFLLTYSYQ